MTTHHFTGSPGEDGVAEETVDAEPNHQDELDHLDMVFMDPAIQDGNHESDVDGVVDRRDQAEMFSGEFHGVPTSDIGSRD